MVLFLLKITPKLQQRQEVLEILHCMKSPTSIQAGCLACEIYDAAGEDPAVLYLERWDSMDAVRRHIQSAAYARILATMEMSSKVPEINFYEVSHSWGLDLVEELRGHGGPDQKDG